jgi:hypothetical protein
MSKSEYPVGYKKPPKNTQFKPGESGNPKGRPKGIQNLSTDLEQELGEKILVTEAGKSQPVTKQRAMIKSLFAKALKGDVRASNVLINLILGLEASRVAAGEDPEMSQVDIQILESYKNRILGKDE